MKLLFLAVFTFCAMAQTAGTISTTTVNTIAAGAGAVSCTFTNHNPALPTGVSVSCKGTAAALLQTSVVPVANASGIVGSFNVGGDAVTWMLTQPTAGVIEWEIAANGFSQKGRF